MNVAGEPLTVRAVTQDRLPLIADLLGRALAIDPIFQWGLGGTATPEDIGRFAVNLYARPTELGMVWEVGDGQGAAVWVPPGGVEMLGGPDNAPEIWEWLESRIPVDSWYLEVLGVDPFVQGAGVGSALVRHGLERAARRGVSAFVETSVADNVAFYQRFGFALVDEADPPGGGPHVWFMRVDA